MENMQNREQELLQAVDALFDANDPQGAERLLLSTRAEAQTAGDLSLELTAVNELIGYYRQTSCEKEAFEAVDDAFSLLQKMGDTDSARYATVTQNAANACRAFGRYEDAKRYYETTERIYGEWIRQGQLEANDLRVAGLYNNRSLLCQELGDYTAAELYLKKALQIVTEQKAGFEIAVTYANLANTCVLGQAYERAEGYARTALRLFRARGTQDAHYCAALSALGSCYFARKEYARAARIFREAMHIVETTIGRNRQYERLQENVTQCEKTLNGNANSDSLADRKLSGLELAEQYYKTCAAPMIQEQFPEYENKIAVGLVGKGSDCFGFDDELSGDHDFGPYLCLWVTDETYEQIGSELQAAYDALPRTFEGYTRNTTFGAGRHGVLKISDFYGSFLGTSDLGKVDYAAVQDYALAACVNGKVFRDDEGIFSAIRERLQKGFPGRARYLRIAQEAAGFSQCAQYNFPRMLAREDETTAQILLCDGMRHAMKLFHYICNAYPPHDKWLRLSVLGLPDGEQIVLLINQVFNQFLTGTDKTEVSETVERLGAELAMRLYDAGVISDVDAYLDHHTEEIVFKAGIVELPDAELVDRIAKLEFEAFDKVKNEGGRAYCQNDWPTFSVMRKSQYLTWDHEMLVQYLYDFTREYHRGHNLITEKYARMMESTDNARWLELRANFPELSDEKKAIIEQIVALQMEMMETFAAEHPRTAANARTLHTYEDSIIDTSYETYLRGEISTYSDKMLQLYGRYVVKAVRDGVNIARATMENTARLYGFAGLEEMERA